MKVHKVTLHDPYHCNTVFPAPRDVIDGGGGLHKFILISQVRTGPNMYEARLETFGKVLPKAARWLLVQAAKNNHDDDPVVLSSYMGIIEKWVFKTKKDALEKAKKLAREDKLLTLLQT